MKLWEAVRESQKAKQPFRSSPFGIEISVADKGEFFARLPSGRKVEYVLKAGEFEIETYELVPTLAASKTTEQTPVELFDCGLNKIREAFSALAKERAHEMQQ